MSESRNIGVHLLTAYPPSNPNRDETGQPKTAVVGGVTRQRISSQCIKRTWRTSEIIQALGAPFSVRTRDLFGKIEESLVARGLDKKTANAYALQIAERFGKLDKTKFEHSEMVTIGREEWDAVFDLARLVVAEKRGPMLKELSALSRPTVSLDCAMFGRMRAANAALNVDAAISVSHPLTVNRIEIEADFWTAVDDLKGDSAIDQGAGGMGEVEYASGVYYTYVEVVVRALFHNTGAKADLTRQAVEALIRAAATTTPGGHRTTFGNRVHASYLRVELGEPSGNLFMSAFEKPVKDTELAIKHLRDAADNVAAAYGLKRQIVEMSVPERQGTLDATAKAAGEYVASVVALLPTP